MRNLSGFNRRSLFQRGGLLAAAQALGGSIHNAVAAPLEFGANLYRSIRQFMNEGPRAGTYKKSDSKARATG